MKIYTSYFAYLKHLHENNIVPVNIALWPPKWYKGLSYKALAPLYFMMRGNLTREQYIENYNQCVLSKLNPNQVAERLRQLTNDKDCALMCFEKPGDFCHRHLAAEWLSKNTTFCVVEYTAPAMPETSKPEPQQLKLF